MHCERRGPKCRHVSWSVAGFVHHLWPKINALRRNVHECIRQLVFSAFVVAVLFRIRLL